MWNVWQGQIVQRKKVWNYINKKSVKTPKQRFKIFLFQRLKKLIFGTFCPVCSSKPKVACFLIITTVEKTHIHSGHTLSQISWDSLLGQKSRVVLVVLISHLSPRSVLCFGAYSVTGQFIHGKFIPKPFLNTQLSLE